MSSFYSPEELKAIGFLNVGEDVLISKKASIYGAQSISVGNHVRIDDFCVLSGKITLGDYIHISAFAGLFAGDYGITFEDFTTFSSRSVIYAQTDDYSGSAMTNPMIPSRYTNVTGGPVVLKKHVIVATGCTILPDVVIGEGVAVGAMSLVNRSLLPWGIYCGIPAHFLRQRNQELLRLENEMKAELGN